MASESLKLILVLLGVSAVAIAASIIFIGISGTGAFFESLYNALTGQQNALTGDYSATAESEARFYAVLWFAYGVLCILAAQELEQRRAWVPWLALVFFAGGCARLIAYFAVGPPHPFFVMLMIIELALPVIMLGLWHGAQRSD